MLGPECEKNDARAGMARGDPLFAKTKKAPESTDFGALRFLTFCLVTPERLELSTR